MYSATEVPGIGMMMADCHFAEYGVQGGQQVVINPTGACAQCPGLSLKVETTTWGRVKSLYRGD